MWTVSGAHSIILDFFVPLDKSSIRRFKESERFDAEHARHDMQCGNDQKRVPFRPQPPSERKEPKKREDRGYAEQKVQGMFSDKLHFFPLIHFQAGTKPPIVIVIPYTV
jgi:hypothetical protein